MQTKLKSSFSLVLLAMGLLIFTVISNEYLSTWRLDLTANKLYTLSDGSKKIIASVDGPIKLKLYFSEGLSEDLTGLRAYERQVEALLSEYALTSNGKIELQVIDPMPFSEEEDEATSLELQGVPVNGAGELLYFGLVGTNNQSDSLVVPFFQPDREAFLEYEISKLVQGLVRNQQPTIGMMSSLKIRADIDMQTFASIPAWMSIQQIEDQFDVRNIEVNINEVPGDLDLLMIVHPKSLGEATLFAIDQYVLAGGHLMVFVDPLAERDQPASANPMMPAPQPLPSDFNVLLANWGVSLREDVVLADAATALNVGGPGGQPVRHLTILGTGVENFSDSDLVISALENINFSSVGILDIEKQETPQVSVLIQSSEYAQPIKTSRLQFLSDPADLQADFAPTGDRYAMAVRINGAAETAFPDGIDRVLPEIAEEENEKASEVTVQSSKVEHVNPTLVHSEQINVIVVADTDFLTDPLWVQVQNFFGQSIASPFANNGEFIMNSVENLVGSDALIDVRSRGQFSRPFKVVDALRREAEAKFQDSADALKARLLETEQQLSALESDQDGQLILSPEQEATLLKFQDEKLVIRKQLRVVRHQLDKDIDALGAALKFINIALVPLLLTFMLLIGNYLRLARSKT